MDPTIRDQGYVYFLSEAPELLQTVEDGLLQIHDAPRVQNVHALMRATHTLKGAAANVGLKTIETVAHSLEDAFKALYNEEIDIDPEMERLLFEGYECLRVPLAAELSNSSCNEDEILDRATALFQQLRDKLGDDFGQHDYIPSSAELGFDITQSIFEMGVQERIDALSQAVNAGDLNSITTTLTSSCEVFIGLGESLGLMGWSELAKTVAKALELNSDRILEVGTIALADFKASQRLVLGGDRESGGQASPELIELTRVVPAVSPYLPDLDLIPPDPFVPPPPISEPLPPSSFSPAEPLPGDAIAIGDAPSLTGSIPDFEGLDAFEEPDNLEDLEALSPISLDELDDLDELDELGELETLEHLETLEAPAPIAAPPPPSPLELEQQRFELFLDDSRHGTPVRGKVRTFFLQLVQAIAHWQEDETGNSAADFILETLIPRLSPSQLSDKKAALKAVKAVRDLGDRFLTAITSPEDSVSLQVYRKWTFLSAMVAIAKCQYAEITDYPKSFKDILLVVALRQLAQNIGDRYQALPAVPARDRQWLEAPAIAPLLKPRPPLAASPATSLPVSSKDTDTDLLESVWGDREPIEEPQASEPPDRADRSVPRAAERVAEPLRTDAPTPPEFDRSRGFATGGASGSTDAPTPPESDHRRLSVDPLPVQASASSRPEARQVIPPPQIPLPPLASPTIPPLASPEDQTAAAIASPVSSPPVISSLSSTTETPPLTSLRSDPEPRDHTPESPAISVTSLPPRSSNPSLSVATSPPTTTLDAVAVPSPESATTPVTASVTASVTANPWRDRIEPHVSQAEFTEATTPDTEAIAPNRKKSSETRQLVSVDLAGIERLNHRLGELLIEQNRLSLDEENLFEATKTMRIQVQQHSKTMAQALEWSEQIMSRMERAGAAYEGKAAQGNDLLTMAQLEGLDFDGYADLHLTIKTALQEALELDAKTGEVTSLVRGSGQAMEKQKQLLSVMQDDLVDVRMLPLQEILDRFTLVLRQLSRLQGKTVNLEISGGELAIEQGVAQRLYDPLLHLVRNAFDHGIEDVETRRSLGKPEVGTIEIRAYNQGTQTTIEVRDDGRGLNIDHIRRKAVEKKFLTQEQADRLISSDRLDILFEPGFSTAAKVSEISGRGVGLDVVRTQIQNLKGSISVQSELGSGTIFSLRIPLSLTIAKLLVVQAGGSAYALLLDAIEKIVMPLPGQTRLFENSKVLQIGEGDEKTMVSVRQLADLMHYTSSLVSSTAEPTKGVMSISRDVSAPILLLRHNNKHLGMEVDHIIGEQELVIRPLGAAIAPPNYVYGCSILSDSRLCLVIDGGEMIDRALTPMRYASPNPPSFAVYAINAPACDLPSSSLNALAASAKPPTSSLDASPPETRRPQTHDDARLLLIVDDSINLRHTLSLTLQKAGYQVVQARDGMEAIEQLEQTAGIDLILCDVEMPRMNGFEFLGTYRQKPELGKVPVITLTSHSSQKYRQIASSLGASAYLTKPYSESELLATVSGLLPPASIE